MSWIQVKSFLQVIVGHVNHADLHASSRSVHVVLRIVGEEVNRTTKFNICTLVVLLVEALRSNGIMCQGESSLNESWLTA